MRRIQLLPGHGYVTACIRLAVIDDQQQSKGIVSMSDILRAFAESSPK